jgi:hypothetical protein
MFGVATQDFLGEMFTAVLVGVGLLWAVTRGSAGGWVAAAVGVANTPATVPALALVVLKRAFDRRRLRYLVVPVVAVLLILVDGVFRGYPFLSSGYLSRDQHGVRTVLPDSGLSLFNYPLFFGVLSILFSFGKGIFFFAPGLLLPARRLLNRIHSPLATVFVLWLVFVAGMVLTYGKWWAWYGGFTWGPRFFLLASFPASLALAAWLRYPPRTMLGLLAVLSVLVLTAWVAVNGVVWGNQNLAACTAGGFSQEYLCWYVPEFSVLWRPFVAPKAAYSPVEIALLLYSVIVLLRLAAQLYPALRDRLGATFRGGRPWLRGWSV